VYTIALPHLGHVSETLGCGEWLNVICGELRGVIGARFESGNLILKVAGRATALGPPCSSTGLYRRSRFADLTLVT